MGERLLLRGNEVIAEAAIRAGCQCYFAYPITPQAELLEHMAHHMPRLGRTFLQAESEVAAISMVYGAAGAGVLVFCPFRSMLNSKVAMSRPTTCASSVRRVG